MMSALLKVNSVLSSEQDHQSIVRLLRFDFELTFNVGITAFVFSIRSLDQQVYW